MALRAGEGAGPAAACTAQRMIAPHRVEGVDAVEDVDLVSAAAERLAQPIDVGGVAAEAVRPKNVVIMQNFMGDLLSRRRPGCCRSAARCRHRSGPIASGRSTPRHSRV